jgi:glycosyltransferase A (GT-A) superfamily protein (DUF2064 family)
LGPLLGRDRWIAVQELLLGRAVAWASEVAHGAVHVACQPVGGEPELAALLGSGVDVFAMNGAGEAGKLVGATVRALGGSDTGPLLIAWPDLPRWRAEHATAALEDLRDGCQLSVGPVFDGGFYLVALARLVGEVLRLPGATWRSADAIGVALAAANAAGIESGLLRPERGLRKPGDARAALADPLLDPELRRLLES